MMIYELLFPQKDEKEKFKLWKLSEEEKICFKTFAYSRISISPGDGLWLNLKIHWNLLEGTGSRRGCHERELLIIFHLINFLVQHFFRRWKLPPASSAHKSSSLTEGACLPVVNI